MAIDGIGVGVGADGTGAAGGSTSINRFATNKCIQHRKQKVVESDWLKNG
jgi:hypothetical protein